MAKAQHVKAGKDYPEFGIKKGDMHYTWSLITGPRSSRTYRQLKAPKRSQLTTSEFLRTVYDIEDDIAALSVMSKDEDSADTPGERLKSDVEDIVQRLRNLASEQEDKFDNMPEGLQNGPTGELLTTRKDGCEAAADEMEGYVGELSDESTDEEVEEVLSNVQGVAIDY